MAKKDNKISMPMSGAGLVRYFDDESVGPKIAPEIVIAITVILRYLLFHFKILCIDLDIFLII